MKLKQKFFVLAGIAGALMAIVSIAGYELASSDLEQSVEGEMTQTVEVQATKLNGWLNEKASVVTHLADIYTSFNGDTARIRDNDISALAASDKDILDVSTGMQDGYFRSHNAGDNTGKKDPTARPWYQQAIKEGKTTFTEVYTDTNTNKPVISACGPFMANGQAIGAICNDITLDALENEVKELSYRGEGVGLIAAPGGTILASSGNEEAMSSLDNAEGWKDHLDEITENGAADKTGFFVADYGGQKSVMVYTFVSQTNWLVGLTVPYSSVFAAMTHLRIAFIVLTLVGLALMVLICLRFATKITEPVMALEGNVMMMADGDLRVEKVPVTTDDEIGNLTQSFNDMGEKLRKLIHRMASTAEQVAASSEELTANAQQSAEASVHVAETVSDVSSGMDQQLTDVDGVKKSIDVVFTDVATMTDKAASATTSSTQASDAAQNGAKLMQGAVEKMASIEQSVMESAEVVKTLGENSQQIGAIVEAISSIAEQTNLLSLNAAIEAARAGEHGRGFAVVADEVRKLAAESQQSAEQIKERIASIQTDTENAVTAMGKGTQEVQEGTAAIREVGAKFSDILSMVEGIKSQMDGINASAQAVEQGATDTVTAVDRIDEVSRKTAQHTQTISAAAEQQSASNEEIAAASQALAKLAGDMQEAIGQFKV